MCSDKTWARVPSVLVHSCVLTSVINSNMKVRSWLDHVANHLRFYNKSDRIIVATTPITTTGDKY
jgi:hypothetical protein